MPGQRLVLNGLPADERLVSLGRSGPAGRSGFLETHRSPFGIMGGFMQPQAHVQYVLRTVLHGQNPQAALDAPRWQWMKARELQFEPGWPAATVDGLRARGHQVTVAAEKSVTFGRGQAIMRLDGAWCGASDLRGDGCAAGR